MIATLVACVAGVFGVTLGFDFVMFDDDINILLNPHLGDLDHETWRWLLTNGSYMQRYLPLGWLAFLTLFAAGGLDPAWYHAANVAIHAGNTVLVYFACRQALSILAPRESSMRPSTDAALAALVVVAWGCHPLRVEPVAWASGLLYLLSASPALAAWLLFVRANERRSAACAVGSVAAYIGSVLVYPTALGFPCVVLGWAWIRARCTGRPIARRLVAAYGVVAAIALTAAIVARLAGDTPTVRAEATLSLIADRAGQAAFVWVYYLWRPLWPSGLGPAYDVFVPGAGSSVAIGASVAVFVAVTIAVLRSRRRCSWALPLWLAYLGFLLPHTGLLERPFFPADRYSYLVGTWAAVAVALVMRRALVLFGAGRVLLPLALASGAFMVSAYRQNSVWHDTHTLFARIDAMTDIPYVRAAYQFRYAVILAGLGDFERAARAEERARRIDPRVAEYRRTLVPEHLRAIGTDLGVPVLAISHHTLALQHAREGDRSGAAAHFARALALAPSYTDARYNRALARAKAGDAPGALADFHWLDETTLPREHRRMFWRLLAAIYGSNRNERLAAAAQARAQKA